MRNLLLLPAALLLLCVTTFAVANPSYPDIGELKLVAQLPAELPQRISGFAYDGEQLWATVYLGRGSYAKLNPSTLEWTIDNDKEHKRVIAEVAGAFQSPGALCFANGKLWIAGAYGESFGSIDLRTWKIERLFKEKQRADVASQTYSSMAYDGNHLWIAWHWFRYHLLISQTQLLLKVDPDSGKVVAEYVVPPGTRNDMTHGLTWDGARLWHMKDNRLSSIDPSTGAVTAQFILKGLKRPSGLAWAKDALWISEFGGQIWRLPFSQ